MSMTLLQLRQALRIRLNDYSDTGQFKDSELEACLNTAKTEMETQIECNLVKVAIAHDQSVAAIDGEYTVAGVFRPHAVTYKTDAGVTSAVREYAAVEFCNLMATTGITAGIPDHWIHTSGDKIQLTPNPYAGAAGAAGTIYVWGYGTSADITSDTASFDTIPSSYQSTYLLDRAEYEARKMRLTNQYTVACAAALKDRYDSWVAMIRTTQGIPSKQQ